MRDDAPEPEVVFEGEVLVGIHIQLDEWRYLVSVVKQGEAQRIWPLTPASRDILSNNIRWRLKRLAEGYARCFGF